jgi:hypothetical protein
MRESQCRLVFEQGLCFQGVLIGVDGVKIERKTGGLDSFVYLITSDIGDTTWPDGRVNRLIGVSRFQSGYVGATVLLSVLLFFRTCRWMSIHVVDVVVVSILAYVAPRRATIFHIRVRIVLPVPNCRFNVDIFSDRNSGCQSEPLVSHGDRGGLHKAFFMTVDSGLKHKGNTKLGKLLAVSSADEHCSRRERLTHRL